MFDPVLVLVVAALLLVGLVMVTSASIAIAEREFGNPFYYLERQLFARVPRRRRGRHRHADPDVGVGAAGVSACWCWRSCCSWRC